MLKVKSYVKCKIVCCQLLSIRTVDAGFTKNLIHNFHRLNVTRCPSSWSIRDPSTGHWWLWNVCKDLRACVYSCVSCDDRKDLVFMFIFKLWWYIFKCGLFFDSLQAQPAGIKPSATYAVILVTICKKWNWQYLSRNLHDESRVEFVTNADDSEYCIWLSPLKEAVIVRSAYLMLPWKQ